STITYIHLYHSFFFFTHTPTTQIYTLSLHDALPISKLIFRMNNQLLRSGARLLIASVALQGQMLGATFSFAERNYELIVSEVSEDRKSTRLNSSHLGISYAVFCLKKKKKKRK